MADPYDEARPLGRPCGRGQGEGDDRAGGDGERDPQEVADYLLPSSWWSSSGRRWFVEEIHVAAPFSGSARPATPGAGLLDYGVPPALAA